MTNAEKFEEVFGIKIDDFPSNICDIADRSICKNANGCDNCELQYFWVKQYCEKKEDNIRSQKSHTCKNCKFNLPDTTIEPCFKCIVLNASYKNWEPIEED